MTKAVLYFLMNVGEAAFYVVMAWGEYLLVKWTGIHAIWVFILWVGTILAMGSCILRKIYLLHEDVKEIYKLISDMHFTMHTEALPNDERLDRKVSYIISVIAKDRDPTEMYHGTPEGTCTFEELNKEC